MTDPEVCRFGNVFAEVGSGHAVTLLNQMRARRPRAIRAPEDGRTEWFTGGAGHHPGSQGPAERSHSQASSAQ